jgi:ribosomal protein L28
MKPNVKKIKIVEDGTTKTIYIYNRRLRSQRVRVK